MTRSILAITLAAVTAAALCVARARGTHVPAWAWLGVMSTVGVLVFWLAPPNPAPGSAAKSGWPTLIALAAAIGLGMARLEGLLPLPEMFNRDGEAAVLIYVAAVVVFFVACRNARTAHRDKQPVAVAHFAAAFLGAATSLVASAAILYLE
jgi:uncharacterized membrane protein YhaH (DUF805 family)